MAEVPTWEVLFERSAREAVDEGDIRATLHSIRGTDGSRDG